MGKIRAIIFDLDGTLVESQPSWRFAEEKLFKRCGHHYDPELARRLGVEPGRALVIEDAEHGLTAARKAGMKCFAVGELDFERKAALADRAFWSLAEIKPEMIEAL